MPFTFTPNRARPPRGCRITKVDDNGLVIQWVSVATTQPAEATRVIFIMEFSWLGLIAVFVLVFCVSARANSQHSANINHANHTLLFTRRWNVWLVSILCVSAAHSICCVLFGAGVHVLMSFRAGTNHYLLWTKKNLANIHIWGTKTIKSQNDKISLLIRQKVTYSNVSEQQSKN